jgi:hypothetical protein
MWKPEWRNVLTLIQLSIQFFNKFRSVDLAHCNRWISSFSTEYIRKVLVG